MLEAGNAKEAMNICQSHDRPIHVLITDIVMPGLGGLELAKSAFELRPPLSVVIVSGYTDRPLDREAIGFGQNSCKNHLVSTPWLVPSDRY